MKNESILFMSPGCGACVQQKKILDDYYRSKGKSSTIKMVNVDRFPDKFDFIKVTPTWAVPQGDQKYALYPGIKDPSRSGRSAFGKSFYDGINNLDYYGKNFPNGKGFDVGTSFYGSVEKVWGKGDDTLNAGVGGSRSLGPNNITEMYSSGYLNNIRMAHPSDQLGTAINLNRECNKTSTMSESKGLVYDSTNPQIVDNTTGFGRRSRFGGLYSQMGPASEIGNQYLIKKDTGKQLFSGAQQNEGSRPYGVKSNTYIGQAPLYNPIGFGKKKKNIGEGSVLKLSRKNKIKVKN